MDAAGGEESIETTIHTNRSVEIHRTETAFYKKMRRRGDKKHNSRNGIVKWINIITIQTQQYARWSNLIYYGEEKQLNNYNGNGYVIREMVWLTVGHTTTSTVSIYYKPSNKNTTTHMMVEYITGRHGWINEWNGCDISKWFDLLFDITTTSNKFLQYI